MLTQRGEQLRMAVGVWKVEEVLRASTDRDRERHFIQRGQHEQTFGSKGVTETIIKRGWGVAGNTEACNWVCSLPLRVLASTRCGMNVY